MNLKHRSAGLLAGLALACALAVPAAAAPKVSGEQPAYVDFSRVLTEYRKTPAFAKLGVKLREQARVLMAEMETLSQLRYCTEAEQKEALTIKTKGDNASAKEKARLAELMKKSDGVDNEAATLSQKKEPTSADSARIAALSKMRTDALRNLAKEEADRRDQMRKMESDLLVEVEAEILKLVEKVAKDQKLPILYERRAVLFGGNDLTDMVIKRLPKQ